MHFNFIIKKKVEDGYFKDFIFGYFGASTYYFHQLWFKNLNKKSMYMFDYDVCFLGSEWYNTTLQLRVLLLLFLLLL